MELTDKYALVTGASSGIGLHMSLELAKRGYSIIAVSNQPGQLLDLKRIIEESCPVRVITLNYDLSLRSSISDIYEFCRQKDIFVEVLINNAGFFIFGAAVNLEIAATETMVGLHIVTPVLLCRLFGEQMVSHGKGYILNVSSITSKMPYPGISLYGSTKSFLRHYTRAIRTEMKDKGINITCLIPGAVSTTFYGTDKYNTRFLRNIGIMKTPSDVANTAIKTLFRNRAECIPGFINRVLLLLVTLVPNSLISLIYRNTDIVRK